MRRALLLLGLAVAAGCSAPEFYAGGAPIVAPARMGPGPACPVVVAMDDRGGAVSALLLETREGSAFIGTSALSSDTWSTPVSGTVPPSDLTEAAMGPGGDAYVTHSDQSPGHVFSILHGNSGGWTDLGFDGAEDLARQNSGNQVVPLGDGRVAVQDWESGGGARSRQRFFLFEDGLWKPLTEWLDQSEILSIHRGPAGQLWMARYQSTATSTTVSLSQWSGSGFVELGSSVTLPGAAAFLRQLVPNGTHATAHFTVGTAYESQKLFDLDGTTWTPLPDPPALILDASPSGLTHDADGNPLLATSGPREVSQWPWVSRYEDAVVVQRLRGGAWEQVFGDVAPHLAGPVKIGFEGAAVIVSWSQAYQWHDWGFGPYTDCELAMRRLQL